MSIFKEALGMFSSKSRNAQEFSRYFSDILVEVHDKNGKLKSRSLQKNIRTNAGADFFNTQLFSTSPGTKGAGFLALTADAGAPASGDTTLTGEILTNGLQRTSALTPSHSSGVAQSVFTNTFTYTGSSTVVIAKIGMFNDTHANGGTLVAESLLSATGTVNQNGDTLTITWTFNY